MENTITIPQSCAGSAGGVVLLLALLALGGCGQEVPAGAGESSLVSSPIESPAGEAGIPGTLARDAEGSPGGERRPADGERLPERSEIRRLLFDEEGAPIPLAEDGLPTEAEEAVRAFYEQRDYRAAWTSQAGLSPSGSDLLQALKDARLEGIDPERYGVRRIEALNASSTAKNGTRTGARDGAQSDARLDLVLTTAFVAHARDLAQGVLDSGRPGSGWEMAVEVPDFEALLQEVADGGEPAAVLRGLRPQVPHYDRMVDALARYRARAEAGGWPELPSGRGRSNLLRVGDRDRLIVLLRARLMLDEEREIFPLMDGVPDRALFDEGLDDALRHFQDRHGLSADGVLGPETLDALNVPVEERIRTIRINLDRWRWIPRSFEDAYILVNVPGFRLDVMEADEPVLSMRVVVGEPAWQTPSFQDRVRYLVLNPWWYLPESIAGQEVLPLAEEDEEYLASRGYERTDIPGVPLRQRPGGANPMGGVKFMFPNRFNIYLHDTPSGEHFGRSSRAFSHGCIRLEEPWKLAEYLLGDDSDWDAERMRSVVGGEQEFQLSLARTLPIYIVYFTSEVAEGEAARFYGDLYGRDDPLESQEALKGP